MVLSGTVMPRVLGLCPSLVGAVLLHEVLRAGCGNMENIQDMCIKIPRWQHLRVCMSSDSLSLGLCSPDGSQGGAITLPEAGRRRGHMPDSCVKHNYEDLSIVTGRRLWASRPFFRRGHKG